MSTPWELADRAQRQLTQAVQEREQIARMLAQIQEERVRMQQLAGVALWCDLGEHPFSGRDRKRTTYKIETIDEDTGAPMMDTLLACGPHAAERRVSLAPKAALPKGADPQLYTEFLEWKAGLKQQDGAAVQDSAVP